MLKKKREIEGEIPARFVCSAAAWEGAGWRVGWGGESADSGRLDAFCYFLEASH